jgi:Icc-related predicted phosphoesterase
MKCVAVGDTHGMYRKINIPDGDVFIHAGDILGRGKLSELEDLNDWLSNLPHKHKIIIAGNHDWCFQDAEDEARAILTNGVYLQDELIKIEGINFYGSPWQPWFLDWAFNLPRGPKIAEKWSRIPSNTDVLITHGPPMGVLDKVD